MFHCYCFKGAFISAPCKWRDGFACFSRRQEGQKCSPPGGINVPRPSCVSSCNPRPSTGAHGPEAQSEPCPALSRGPNGQFQFLWTAAHLLGVSLQHGLGGPSPHVRTQTRSERGARIQAHAMPRWPKQRKSCPWSLSSAQSSTGERSPPPGGSSGPRRDAWNHRAPQVPFSPRGFGWQLGLQGPDGLGAASACPAQGTVWCPQAQCLVWGAGLLLPGPSSDSCPLPTYSQHPRTPCTHPGVACAPCGDQGKTE